MAVSIADMERIALGGGDDFGSVIDLGDLNDDFGLNMLSNSSSSSSSKITASQDTGRTVSFTPSAAPAAPSFDTYARGGASSSSSGLGSIEVTPLEPLESISMNMGDTIPIDMNDFGSSSGPSISFSKEPAYPSSSSYSNAQSATGPGVHLASARDPEAEKKEKTDYLNKLQRLEQKGFPVSRKFTMDNSLEEMKTEYFRLVDARNLEASLKFQRQMLMLGITGLEWLNERFDPFDLKLEGWSESANENIEDFDEIFEELYDKYKDKAKMSPEMRLVMAIGGSGFMCHVSNSFFRSKMPSMDNVLRNNPELARQMAQAAAAQAGPGFGNFMGMAMGAQPSVPANGGPPMPPMPTQAPSVAPSSTGAFFGASAAPPPFGGVQTPSYERQMPPPITPQAIPTARREMSGPSGMEDILKTFEEVRRAEAMASTAPPSATGFATQPAVAAAMNSAASVISAEDILSQAESTRTGATGNGGRGRRRRTQAPVGNTYSLNV